MHTTKTLTLGLGLMLAAALTSCAQETTPEPATEAANTAPVHGVVIALEQEETPEVTMLVDGEPHTYAITADLAEQVQEGWEEYSHWGLYQTTFEDDEVVSLEYGEGVSDIVGIYADKESGKTLADVLSFANDEVTITSIANLLDSADPDELPGFTSENPGLTPADGESFEVSSEAVIYVEGSDELFTVGTSDLFSGSAYDYIEFYDVDGDWIYDQVIVWLI